MLERKGIATQVTNLLPGMHPVMLRAVGFRGGTVPALKLDGKRVQGSLRIARFLEQLKPHPPLFPADPERRAAVEEAEFWGERELQEIPRRLFRWAAEGQPAVRRWLGELSGMPAPGLMGTLNLPVARRFARVSGATDDAVRRDLHELPATLGRVDGYIDRGVVGAEEGNPADFQLAGSIRILLEFPQLRSLIEGRPSGQHSLRLLPQFPGPVPIELPAAWLPDGA